MTGKPIGTMFVELDLDASRYTKGQQKLLKDAQSTTLNIEQNFKNLGIKSSAEMDLMRAKIKNSFDMIANSSKATANDIIRAEKAKNDQLAALNAKQFGEQKSLIENLKSNWLAYGAGVFATYQIISRAIDMTATGSKLEKQAAAFENLSAAAGTSAERMLDSLKRVSGGMVAEADLIGAAGKAMLMKIPAGEITKLMEISAATSKSTGQTITEAFNDITMGVARQSKMILDNLGIIVDVDKANRDYAKALGKTAEGLTDAEKRQAFMNSVMKSGDDMIKRIGSSAGSLDGVNKLIASHSNMWDEVNKTVATFLDNKLPRYASWLDEITEKLKGMRAAGADLARSDMLKDIELLRSLEGWWGKVKPGTTMSKMNEFNTRFVGASESELASEAAWRDWQKPDAMAAWREREGNYADFTEAELKAMADARDKIIKGAQDNGAKIKKAQEDIWKDYKPRYAGSQQSEAMLADQKAFEDWKKLWSSYSQRLPESQQSEAMLADQARFDEWKKQSEGAFNWMTELSERTAESMQENFSDLFFDAYKGKLQSWQDITQAAFDSILKAWSDLQGQMLTQAIFGNKAVGGTGGGGGLMSWLSGLFTGSGPEQLGQYPASARGNIFGENGVQRFARGGVVTRPTVFPFSRGVGLMGEAGPEAVIPLKRLPSGRLGVEAAGGGSVVNVTVNNNTGQPVETRETRGPSGQREIEIMVGQILAKDGPASRALADRYGLRRRGVMR